MFLEIGKLFRGKSRQTIRREQEVGGVLKRRRRLRRVLRRREEVDNEEREVKYGEVAEKKEGRGQENPLRR